LYFAWDDAFTNFYLDLVNSIDKDDKFEINGKGFIKHGSPYNFSLQPVQFEISDPNYVYKWTIAV
jgi:hypothetical protein